MRRGWLFGALLLAACGGVQGDHVLRVQPPPLSTFEGHEDALELRLAAVAQALQDQGFARAAFRERGFLPTNGRATRAVSIEPKTCARFVAVATPSVIDLDASLYRSDGTPLIEDDGSDARPSLTLCAGSKRVDAYYAIHAYQGVGAYATAQFVRPSIEGDDLLTVPDEERGSALNELAKTLHKRGFEDAGPRVKAHLQAGRALRVAVAMRSGDCYTLAGEGAPSLAGLSLRLLDGERELGHGVASDHVAALQFCSDRAQDLALEINAISGEGAVRIGRFRAPQAAVGGPHAMWLGEPSPSREAWLSATKQAALAKASLRPGKSSFAEEHALVQGQVVELESRAALGECEVWQAFLQPGLFRATLRVEALDGAVYGEATSDDMVARVTFCGRTHAARVIVTGRAGFGRVSVLGKGTTEAEASAPQGSP